MSSLFAPLCQAIDEQKHNNNMIDSLVSQFMRSASIEPDSLAAMAVDPLLERFLQIMFKILTRDSFPSPSEGVIPPICVQTLQFLTTMAYNNPDLRSTIAGVAPMDDIPAVLFGRNVTGDRIADPQSSHLLSSLRFLVAVSCSHEVVISSTASLHVLFGVLFSLFCVSPLAALAAAAVSGFAHNCPSACAFIKSLPNFMSLKAEFVGLLGSSDRSIVVASMSAITALFEAGSDAETLMKLAVRAVVSPPAVPAATALSCWTILDLVTVAPLTAQSFIDIVKALLSSTEGLRALNILVFLTEIHRLGMDCFGIIMDEGLLSPLTRFVLATKYDYVTAGGVQYIQTITEERDVLDFGDDFVQLFGSAIDRIVVACPTSSLLRLESILVVLRTMLRANNLERSASELLAANQSNLFVGFQRHIEGNHSFLSLSYFLFIYECTRFHKAWRTNLFQIIAETQFSSLLVHVLTHSTNRMVLADACRATSLISNGLTQTGGMSPLTDTLVSGFLLLNRANTEERKSAIDAYESTRCELRQVTRACAQERETFGCQLGEMERAKSVADSLAISTNGELAVSREQILHLKEKVRSKSKKSAEMKHEITRLMQELSEMKVELQHREHHIGELTESAAVLRTRVKGFKGIEEQLKEVTLSNNDFGKEIARVKADLQTAKEAADFNRSAAENEKTGRRQAEEKMYDLSSQLSTVTIRLHEQEVMESESRKQAERLEALLKKKGDRLAAAEEVNRGIRQHVSELQEQLENAGSVLKRQRKTSSQLQEQLAEFEAKNRDRATLCQFIHRITLNKGIITDEHSDEEYDADDEMDIVTETAY